MREAIQSAPKNGTFVILEDAAHGDVAVARWSEVTSQWLDDDDKPVQLSATHWYLPQTLGPRAAAARRNTPTARPEPVPGPARAETPGTRFAGLGGRASGWIIRRKIRVVTMATVLLVGAALSTLLYRGDIGLARPHWTAPDESAGLKQALEQQRDRANALSGELTVARHEAESQAASIRAAGESAERQKQASERALAALRQSLQLELSKTEKLAEQLADAQRAGAAQTALTQKSVDEAMQLQRASTGMVEVLQQERAKVEELRVTLAAVKLEAADQRATWLSASGEAARQQEASARVTEALRTALRQAESKAEELTSELVETRRKADLQTSIAQAASAEARRISDSSRQSAQENSQTLREAQVKTAKISAELSSARQSLEAERSRAEQLEHRLIALQTALQDQATRSLVSPAPAAAETLRPAAVAEAPANVPAMDDAQPRNSPPRAEARFEQVNAHAVRLIARAHLLLDLGNIGAARNMLDQAAEMGSPEALFWLAETYDPLLLPARKTLGTQSDIAKAREFYGRALAGGVAEARSRLDSLQK